MTEASCPFCEDLSERIIFDGQLAFAIWDKFPVSPGHILVIPKRHIESWFDASVSEQLEIFELLGRARKETESSYAPDGYNVGINIGEIGGQTVPHMHLHLIPRYLGDVVNPRGGVRHVIPELADYSRDLETSSAAVDLCVQELMPRAFSPRSFSIEGLPHNRALITGGNDPLLPHLLGQIDIARAIDFNIAFVLESGLNLVMSHIEDLLERGGGFRLVTGDYLGVTEPRALERLLDMHERYPGQILLRVFESNNCSFHPKSFIFHTSKGEGLALVGSSNLTKTALLGGIEWNMRTTTMDETGKLLEICNQFDALLLDESTKSLTHEWVVSYAARRPLLRSAPEREIAPSDDEHPAPSPNKVQEIALERLKETRENGNSAGLVVMATGLGKTWLSAFDAEQISAKRILFVAHREEILGQAMATFRRTRPHAQMGLYTGKSKDRSADVLFASVQTLSKKLHLEQFEPTDFDYVVIDEFHHAAARTYRRIIDYFEPSFLLGLTATPERTDGGDLLSLCQENLVFRCDLNEGIRLALLSSFHYFGVPDEVDYANIPWRSSKFDEEALTTAVATVARAENALEQFRTRGGSKAIGFCCSQRHADFMGKYFRENGLRVAVVHAGQESDPRSASLEKLSAGELDIVFAVDMFNEGVDVPAIDTVMMLRPTESRILWLQQLGRGLRKFEGKDHLKVIDYIGNHRTFLLKPQTLFDLPSGDVAIERLLSQLQRGEVDLPPGCEVTYDLESMNILRGLLRSGSGVDALRFFYEDFRDRTGRRPSLVEVFHEGHPPRSVRTGYGSWFGFVKAMGDLSEEEVGAFGIGRSESFLETLETTRMTRSFKMLVLLAMVDVGQIPGKIPVAALAREIRKFASRSAVLKSDFTVSLDDLDRLIPYLEGNPIEAWTGGKADNEGGYFSYEDRVFSMNLDVADDHRIGFSRMVRELVDFRLSEYIDRASKTAPVEDYRFLGKVFRSGVRVAVTIPDRRGNSSIPSGWASIRCEGEEYEADFGALEIASLRRPNEAENILPSMLNRWFGPEVGHSGTDFSVEIASGGGEINMNPVLTQPEGEAAVIGDSYMRADIPPLFGLEFRESTWNQGYVNEGGHIFLLVTLEKKGMAKEHQYDDRFLSPNEFRWVSQNRHKRESPAGQLMKNHTARGVLVHLFVRKRGKIASKAAPFLYCGDVQFKDWEDDAPIKIRWKLQKDLPERTMRLFEPL